MGTPGTAVPPEFLPWPGESPPPAPAGWAALSWCLDTAQAGLAIAVDHPVITATLITLTIAGVNVRRLIEWHAVADYTVKTEFDAAMER
jgi:hypothetical protein